MADTSFHTLHYLHIGPTICLLQTFTDMDETDEAVYPEEDEHWERVVIRHGCRDQRGNQVGRGKGQPVHYVRDSRLVCRYYFGRVSPVLIDKGSSENHHEDAHQEH